MSDEVNTIKRRFLGSLLPARELFLLSAPPAPIKSFHSESAEWKLCLKLLCFGSLASRFETFIGRLNTSSLEGDEETLICPRRGRFLPPQSDEHVVISSLCALEVRQ